MGLIQVTNDVAARMGLSKNKIYEGIRKGTFAGKQLAEGSRIYLIDDSVVPIPKDEKPPEVSSQTPIIEVPKDEQMLDVERLILFAEKQKQLVENYIKLQEIRRVRDSPNALKLREQSIAEREVTCSKRENFATQKELELSQKEANLKLLNEGLSSKTTETKRICDEAESALENATEEILATFDLDLISKVDTLKELDEKITQGTTKLDGLMDIISEYPKIIEPFYNEVKKMVRISNSFAKKQYDLGDNTNGEIAERHVNLANKSWAIGAKLKSVLDWMSGDTPHN